MESSLNYYSFNKVFKAFRSHVQEESNSYNLNFVSNPYLEEREFYKYEVYNQGRKHLNFKSWKKSDIGKGDIVKAVLSAIEIHTNNLVNWHPRYGEAALPHNGLKKAIDHKEDLVQFESVFYELYHSDNDEFVFNELVSLIGRKYSLIAYLFFLKDRNRYMPIATSYFDKGFRMLGVDFKTSQKCSWSNYQTYNGLLGELKLFLEEHIDSDITLLDAHSFLWIVSRVYGDKADYLERDEYQNLTEKDREILTKARVGQGEFRKRLLKYWKVCPVTGCANENLLIASHIKPWKDCTIEEALDTHNGILFSPAIDSAFDIGLISFENDGQIIISNSFSTSDARSVGINPSINIKHLTLKHKKYLDYHRAHVFESK